MSGGQFDSMIDQLKADYLDGHKGGQAWINQASQFDDSSPVSTTYLGRIGRSRRHGLKAIINQRSVYNDGYFTQWYIFKILPDSHATKSFISKQYYLRKKSLHGFPKFSSKSKVIQVEMWKLSIYCSLFLLL